MRIFTILFITNFIVTEVLTKTDCKLKLQQCENKKPTPRRPVCGTDNQTYPNRCALLRVQCAQNIPLAVKHRGRCKEKQPCWMDQGKKMASGSGKDPKIATNITPECLADGTYAPVQCHKSVGYCWCVTPNGKIIPGTTVHHRKPECPKRGRRAFVQKSSEENVRSPQKKGCDQLDRNTFIRNLLRIFKTEYNRDVYGKHYADVENQTGTSLEAKAVQWKFVKLDKDKNNTLSRNEYRDLRKLIKKVVRPKRCSRAFIRLCDVDQSTIITKQEWINCLDVNNTHEIIKTTTEETSLSDQDSENDEADGEETHSDPASVLEESALPLNDRSVGEDDEEKNKAMDCTTDRKAAMDEYKLGTQGIFVPECTSDGLYKKIQCFRSTGYCWCVFEDTGRPIPGTSLKDSHPNCEIARNQQRPMKGCPDQKRITFVKDLLDYFKRNMSNSSHEVYENNTLKGYEYSANLGFQFLDMNKNKILERKEWKIFRSMVSANKILRRCGRKLPRYCDVNHDQKINITEWRQCLTIPTNGVAELHNSVGKRRGPNPIDTYLREEE